MLGALDLGSHNIETPGQVSAFSRRTEIRRGRELDTGTGLRYEILATRRRPARFVPSLRAQKSSGKSWPNVTKLLKAQDALSARALLVQRQPQRAAKSLHQSFSQSAAMTKVDLPVRGRS